MNDFYSACVRPLLFSLSPELAHALVTASLKLGDATHIAAPLIDRFCRHEDAVLNTACFGLEFANPIGLAAGFDKNADLPNLWPHFGFGFVELGTVTRQPQTGNRRPRLFRLPEDRALINRMGFNNVGMYAFRSRMMGWRNRGLPAHARYGINIGKSKVTPLEAAPQEYAELFRTLSPLADYVTINVSSPNTPNLRKLQDKDALNDILSAVQSVNTDRRPLLLKIAPDLSLEQIDEIIDLILIHKLSGVISANTTLSREGLAANSHLHEAGGLSGAPLKARSTAIIRHIAAATAGKLPIVGVGGIETAEDAYDKIRAGASLVQVYTGFVYGGPQSVRNIASGLAVLLKRDGFASVKEAVGSKTARL